MSASINKTFCFFSLFQKFINDSRTGRRLQPNGKRISQGTVDNYVYTLKLLKAFSDAKSFPLRIRSLARLRQREWEREKNYWKKFYKKFSDYLYIDCGHLDNYFGQNIKNIKAFFSYTNKEYISTGDFYKRFYVRKEEIPIFPLLPEELNFLIYDKKFEASLSTRMCEVKDAFVFGCTVALRVSDLLALKKSSVRSVNGVYYLSVRSIKTHTDTIIRLPDYAVAIIKRYLKKSPWLLPKFNKSNLNKYIKKLLEQAGFTQEVLLRRTRRGLPVIIKNCRSKDRLPWRFCDVASTHTMRRTAITTMLSLGVPEGIVRKVSGHSPGSKEFYRYVLWAQTYQDKEIEKMFDKLKDKTLKIES